MGYMQIMRARRGGKMRTEKEIREKILDLNFKFKELGETMHKANSLEGDLLGDARQKILAHKEALYWVLEGGEDEKRGRD